MSTYDALNAAFAALGIRLFTITIHQPAAAQVHRAYSSNPQAYPISGKKPLADDAWSQQVIGRGELFVANTASGFADLFPDHAQIVALGCNSCANLPIFHDGQVLGTLNLLAEEAHFTAERLMRYTALASQYHTALVAEISTETLD